MTYIKDNKYDPGNFNRPQGVKGQSQQKMIKNALTEQSYRTINDRQRGRMSPIPKGNKGVTRT